MQARRGDEAKTLMATASGTDLAGYNAQLAATRMFFEPQPAVEFLRSDDVVTTMKNVAAFSFKHGLLGEGAPRQRVHRHCVPRRQGRWLCGQREAPVRRHLHGHGGERRAVAGASTEWMEDASRQTGGRAGARRSSSRPCRSQALVVVYLAFSDIRLEANPDDKLLPSVESFADAILRMAFEPSVRTRGDPVVGPITAASLRRLGIGIGVSALAGFTFGILNGLIPWFSATWSPLVRVSVD